MRPSAFLRPLARELGLAFLVLALAFSGILAARAAGAQAGDPLAHAALCLPGAQDEGGDFHDCGHCTLPCPAPLPGLRGALAERRESPAEPPPARAGHLPVPAPHRLPWSRGPPEAA